MTSGSSPDKIRGWILDAYPSGQGEMYVWIISETNKRICLTDSFRPKIYVSSRQEEIELLISRLHKNRDIANWNFAYKYADPTNVEKSKVLELELKDCRRTNKLTNRILRMGGYSSFQVHNSKDRNYQHGPLARLPDHLKNRSGHHKARLIST